jgi:hypothetical protein
VQQKIERFMPAYKGQMELYLAWLKDNEMKEDENSPIGIILCTQAQRQRIEYLQLENPALLLLNIGQNFRRKSSLKVKYRKLWQKRENILNARNYLERQTYKSK